MKKIQEKDLCELRFGRLLRYDTRSTTDEGQILSWTLSKLNIFALYKTLKKKKDKPQTERKYLQIIYLTKKSVSRYIKKSQNSKKKKKKAQLKNRQTI